MAIVESLHRHKQPLVVSRTHGTATNALAGALSQSASFRRFMAASAIGLLAWAAYAVAYGKYYTPRSTIGFYLGVAGTLMMLALLAYPLRKHVRWMQRWGALKHWFRIHMILGIVGPTLILFHSTFHIRSPNAAVALLSMLVVVASGIIGRFVYSKIHYGLYGRRATLASVREDFSGQSSETKSRLHFAPKVEQWLLDYENQTMDADRSLFETTWHLLTLKVRRTVLEIRCARELRRIFGSNRRPEFREGAPEAIHLVSRYIREVERVAHFSTYEGLFSLWHVLHIPLIYLLAGSTIFHIVAVYMY